MAVTVTSLGTTADGRVFTYDASLYEFYLDGETASFCDVQMLDSRNWIRWRAPELRDWFVRIDAAALDSCNRRARIAFALGSQPMSRLYDLAGFRMAQTQRRVDAERSRPSQAEPCQSRDTFVYRSDNEAVASVDSEGNVRVNGEGTASIFARRERANSVGAEVRLVGIEVPHAPSKADDPAPELAPAPDPAPAPAPEQVMLKSNAAQSFKSKRGKLGKDRSFAIASCIDAPVVFKKLSGTPYAAVSQDGVVGVFRGLEKGSYLVLAQATPVNPPLAVNVIEMITIEIRVK